MKRTDDFHVVGIDPGLEGAIVAITRKSFQFFPMPVKRRGKKREPEYSALKEILRSVLKDDSEIVLERSAAFGMGATSAFNYGRGFAMIECALADLFRTPVLVMPAHWCAEMHAGLSSELPTKVRSALAVEKLYPKFARQIPRSKTGKMHEGIVDALLIAAYGARHFLPPKEPLPDF